MATSPVNDLLSRLEAVTPAGDGQWKARCPAHDDRNPSLSITAGDDGTALVRCWAGCETESICTAVGLSLADLFPDRPGATSSRPAPAKRERKADATFSTCNEALRELDRREKRKGRQRVRLWTYHDAGGVPVGVVVRYETPDGSKAVIPISRQPDGQWSIRAMPEPRLLYQLPTMAGAERVYVTEGEKAADAIISLRLVATTSPGGCKAASKADWSPLAGKQVIILPDADEPGERYAEEVIRLLSSLTPTPTIKVVRLPGLPAGGDAVEWIEAGGTRDDLTQLVESAEPIEPETGPEPWPSWEPFPAGVLPEPLRSLVQAGARAFGCDESFVALPALSVCAAAIGSTRRLRVRNSWRVPSILWVAVVADSGSGKSPAFRLATRPVRERQQRLIEDAIECSKTERVITSNATIEALSVLLRDNPRGLLMAVDELAGWFASFGQYNNRSSGDAAAWLSLFDGESFVIDRKTGDDRMISVPRTAMSLCGTIQPAILRKALSADHRESGLAARLLMACPPRKPKRWTEGDVDERLETEYAAIVERLYDMQSFIHPETGRTSPIDIDLSREAKAEFVFFLQSSQRRTSRVGRRYRGGVVETGTNPGPSGAGATLH